MKLENLNRWNLTPTEAVGIQKALAGRVRGGELPTVRTVLGLDVSYRKKERTFAAGGVLLSLPSFESVQSWYHTGYSTFPYVPGLLSFREVPPLLLIMKKAPRPDLIIVDGQGTAHPRGLGLASHIGLITQVPTIGCAKSFLAGHCDKPGPIPGSQVPIVLEGKTVGYALRSKKNCKPLYISPGHLLDPDEALRGVIMCLKGYRLPEPTRLADKLSKGKRDV
jgi:deoxyribonuclease V